MTDEEARAIAVPVLIAVGTNDEVAGSGTELAELIPGAEHLAIPGRDHMLAVGDKAFKAGVLEFLTRRP
jgi:pimeloyl-ACP methyl ester carboxylesterase